MMPKWMPVLVLFLGGCGLFHKTENEPVQEVTTKGTPERPAITVGELDQMARNYSDRLVARVSTACDQIKADAREDDDRVKAHQLKLSVALAAYDIVSSPGGSPQIPGAAQHVLDLAILTELEAVRWIDEKAARDTFGERGAERLGEALSKAREDIWGTVARVMKPEQVDQMRTFILHWRQQNPKIEWVSRVRLDAIAQGREGASFSRSVGEGFNPIHAALQAVDETRLTAEQALFYIKRMPTLLEWTTEATVSGTLDVPKVSGLVDSLRQTLGTVQHATGTLERLTEPSSQEPAINSTIGGVRDVLVQAKELVQEIHGLQAAVQPMLDRKKNEAPKGKPLDLDKVTSNISDVTREATSLVRETRTLTESPSAMQNVDELLGRTGRTIKDAGDTVIDHATWRAIELVIVIAVLVVVYKVVAALIRKRRGTPAKA